MSKAEDKAWEKYPYKEGYDIELEYPSTYDENEYQRKAYIEGYHQAEKDNELTWEDIKVIEKLLGFDNIIESPKEYYQEVLKRFEERKEK